MIITFVLHSILIISIINYLLLLFVFFQRLIKTSNDIFQYKIINFYFTIFSSVCYIFIVFLLLYAWRICNINNIINLKTIFDNYHRIWLINISHFNIIYQLYLLIFGVVIIFSFFICLVKLLQYVNTQVFKLYIYNYNYIKRKKLIQLCEKIGNTSIISYLFRDFLIYNLKGNLDLLSQSFYKRLLNFIFFSNYTRTESLITLSPLILLIYDIFYNDFLLTHFSYYSLFYIPMMLLKRLTAFLAFNNNILIETLHKIFYVIETDVIYAINPKFKAIFDNIITRLNIETVEIIDISFYLKRTICFELRYPERNVYINDEGIYLKLTSNNKVFEEIIEEETLFDITTKEGYKAFMEFDEEDPIKIRYKLGKEWILLLKK